MAATNPLIGKGLGRVLKRKVLANMTIPKRTFEFHMQIMGDVVDIEKADLSQLSKEAQAALPKDGVIITGWASTKDLDRANIVMHPDCFRASMDDFMKNPVLLLMHDWGNPVGKVIEASISEMGLHVKAFVSGSAKTVVQLIKEGILSAFSVGYRVMKSDDVDSVEHVHEAELHEISIVTIPRNQNALFSVAAGVQAGTDIIFKDLQTGEMRSDMRAELDQAKEEIAALQQKLKGGTGQEPPLYFEAMSAAFTDYCITAESVKAILTGLGVVVAELGIKPKT